MAKTKKIELEAIYPFGLDEVWTALTDKRALSEWLMKTDFEPEVGRRFVFRAKPVPGWRGFVEGEVLKVDRPRLISYSWVGNEGQPPTMVTFRLEPFGQGSTRVSLVHDGWRREHGVFDGLMSRMMLKSGWRKMLDKMLPKIVEHVGRVGMEAPFPAGILAKRCH